MYTFRHSVFSSSKIDCSKLEDSASYYHNNRGINFDYLNIGVYSIPSSIFLLALIALTWWNRREFDRISYIYAWEDIVKDFWC